MAPTHYPSSDFLSPTGKKNLASPRHLTNRRPRLSPYTLPGAADRRVDDDRGMADSRVDDDRGMADSRVDDDRGTADSRVDDDRGT
jgi:hypothetical protein